MGASIDILNSLKPANHISCGTLKFAVEPLNDVLWPEFVSKETDRLKELGFLRPGDVFVPNKDERQTENALGYTIVCTVRQAGKLVGLCVLMRWKCRQSCVWVVGEDSVYIDKPLRAGRVFLRFMTYLESVARDAGAQKAEIQPVIDGPHVRALEKIGYRKTRFVMEKDLANQNRSKNS